ncbi:sulfatase [Pseudozobellia sp. WGM2]|uniref:sulfatase n=1 Tax=Pseudozobellia sp. WGM2 TaxID=2787625 RepID=UPI001ADFFA03|nr:sulfatase [Pseudozobellia sp. WGM2]
MKNIIVSILVLNILISCNTPSKQSFKEKSPNIIFILADDLGWADLPVYGNEFNEAPNLDKLAQQAMRFTNAYAANPVCSPSRASIQTGLYPARIGINDFLPGHWRPHEKLMVPMNKTQYLPLDYETIGEALKPSGYATGYFGKWHLGHTEKHHPKNQGYDESLVHQGGRFFNFNEQMHPTTDFPDGKILSEALTDKSIDFIENNKDQPFFLFLAHFDVHVQLDAHSEQIEKFIKKPKADGYPSNAIYAAMVENIDKSVGRIMNKLEYLNLADDTIIIFFSDNGGLVSRFDEIPLIAKNKLHYYEGDSLQYIASSNQPLRAEKGTVYEGGIKEPLLIKWPKKVTKGSQSDAIVSSIDLFPTIIEMATGETPKNQTVDGVSMVPTLKGLNHNNERAVFWHYPVYHHSVPASAIRKGDWKLIQFLDDDRLELYNLINDIGESHNLAYEESEKAEELLQLLNNWREKVDAAMPIQNPHFDKEKRKEWGRHPNFEDMVTGTSTTQP